MTLSFIIGPVVALAIFIIFITDKWEVVMHGSQDTDRDKIYQQYHQLQNQKIRCKVVREDPKTMTETVVYKLLVMKQDLDKKKVLL